MSEHPIRVMLVDDHATFREPLAFLMEHEPDLEVVAQAGTLAEAQAVLEDGGVMPDVVVVDLDLPDGPGATFVEGLRGYRPGALALVLSAYSEPRRLAEAIEVGAAGVMHKSTRPQEVMHSIRRLHAGEPLLSQQQVLEAVWLMSRERLEHRQALKVTESLTPRERDVLTALVEGSSDKEIAEKLYLSAGTVRVHVTNILGKLGVHSRLQAVVFAVRHGIVELR